MISKNISELTETINEVAEKLHNEDKSLTGEALAKKIFDILADEYTFVSSGRSTKTYIKDEVVTLSDGSTAIKKVEETIIQSIPISKSIYQLLHGHSLDLISTIQRIVDESAFERPALKHNPNENEFIKNAATLFYNTDAYSVGSTLTNFRIFCQNIHKNLKTPGSDMAENIALYQYSNIGGTGKSQLGKVALEAMKRLGYEAGYAKTSGRWIGNEFSRYIVAFNDEFMPPKGEAKDYFIEKFNPIVCNDYYEVEYKGRDKYHIKSIASLILNSNYYPTDVNMRRYGMIKYNERNIIKYEHKPDFETMVDAFIKCLETVPFNEYWENPIKVASHSMSELVWMARELVNSGCVEAVLSDCTIRQFVNMYVKLTQSNVKPIAYQRSIFQTLIENNIEPSHRVNGNLMYSRYDFEAIADMETNEDAQECSLDNIVDSIERTKVAFEMYLNPDNDPTEPNPDNDPTEPKPTNDNDDTETTETTSESIKEEVDIWQTHFMDNIFAVTPSNNEQAEYCVINPLKPNTTRKDANVATLRHLVFEMDDTELDEQKAITRQLTEEKIINKSVFSGNKSIHNRITLAFEPESIAEYKFYWEYLNNKHFQGKADTQCKNPSRLTRNKNGIRNDKKTGFTDVLQIGIEHGHYCYDKEDLKSLWKQHQTVFEEKRSIERNNLQLSRLHSIKFNEQTEEAKLTNFYKANPEKWQLVKDLYEGIDPGSGANLIGAIGQCKQAGFTDITRIVAENAHRFHPSNIGKSHLRNVV